MSLLMAAASVCTSCLGLPSNNLLHQPGGSKGLDPLCSDGYTSLKKYHTITRHQHPFPSLAGVMVQLTMTDNDPTNLILRHRPMQHQRKPHEHPRQIRRREDQESQKAQARLRIPSAPDVHQTATQRGAQEGHREQWGQEEEDGGGVEEQPGEMGGGAAGGFFEEAGVALEEEDVEDQVDGEGAEVEERCQDAPVL
ncbi:MAG: hypothetical protein M1827_005736 [Pycnora praestabilis]|nr:MAG: hypothetical protein M1827_005736 [Pycnora praestabilis]